MIIPIGHDKPTLRGFPRVTLVLIALCVLLFLVTLVPSNRAAERSAAAFMEVAEAFRRQPTLEVDPVLENMLFAFLGVDENQRELYVETLTKESAAFRGFGPTLSQADFDALVQTYWTAHRSSPSYWLGVVPRDISLYGLVTYQFMHGGWLHLFGNLLFLFLAGPRIEERWGRALFTGFYLAAGVVAALFWAFRYPLLDVPLVGASGSIAGVMGAFLVCFGASKIRFFYFGGIIWGTFDAPAWLMLPLWLVIEVISGRSMDLMAQGQGGGGVAHWAHVWGFIFGMAVAAVVGRVGLDRRLGRVDEDESASDEQVIDRAFESATAGDVDGALAVLRGLIESDPNNDAAAMAIWNICTNAGRKREAVPALLGVVRRASRVRDDEGLIENWRILVKGVPQVRLEPVLGLRIAEVLQRHRHRDLLLETISRVETSKLPGAPPVVVARLAKLAAENEADGAADLLATALAHDELAFDLRTDLEVLAKRLAETPQPVPTPPGSDPGLQETVEVEEVGPTVELRPSERLQVAEGVPLSLADGALTLDLDKGKCRLPLGNIHAVAVGAIREPDRRPFLVVDLLLDSPWDGAGDLRVVRLRSSSFDPRSLVGGDNAMAALTRLLEFVVTSSGAAALPGDASIKNPGVRSFGSIEDYQQEVLGITW